MSFVRNGQTFKIKLSVGAVATVAVDLHGLLADRSLPAPHSSRQGSAASH